MPIGEISRAVIAQFVQQRPRRWPAERWSTPNFMAGVGDG